MYFTRRFEFDNDFDNFDRDISDFSGKAWGRIVPGSDPPSWEVPAGYLSTNPLHYSVYIDKNVNATGTFLDANGEPALTAADARQINVQYYKEDNLLLLGIPPTLTGV